MACRLSWRMIRVSYPWIPLAITLWRIAGSTDIQRQRALVRFWLLVGRINFAGLWSIATDLIQPEYWA